MSNFVIRLWLPDRPGALGAVASRIGAVRADVVSIEIIEREDGRALDELTIDLKDAGLLNLLVAEIEQVDGVEVAHIRPALGGTTDPALSALRLSRELLSAESRDAIERALVEGIRMMYGADWVLLTPDPPGGIRALAVCEDAPSREWFEEFIVDSARGERPYAALESIEHRSMDEVGMALLISRKGANMVRREIEMLDSVLGVAFVALRDA